MCDKLTNTENTVLGGVAAFIEAIILQPTLYFKNAQAQRLPISLNPRVIYRGTGASIYNEIQMMALQFGFTSFFRTSLGTGDTSNTVATNTGNKLLSASLGGAMSAVFVSPVELIMIQQQRFGGNMLQVTMTIGKKYGIGSNGIMRAVFPTILRDSLYVAGMLGVTPMVQDFLMTHNNLSENQAGFYASLIGGAVAAIPSHPLDIVKTCMQGDLEQASYKGFVAATRQTWSEGGVRRMFNGCFWRAFNITGTIIIANWCSNNFPRWIYPERFQE